MINTSGLDRFRVSGATALVTGAAGGMGEHLARRLAAGGAEVIMVDRDASGLDRVEKSITDVGSARPPQTVVVDLADPAATESMIAAVHRDRSSLDLVINNAGVAMAGRFDEVSAEEFDWLLQIDLLSPIMITRGLLPLLRVRPGGHIVNVSSVFGLHGPYGQAAYATAKFGLRGFSQSLAAELADDRIGVTCVMPGGIRTGIARSARIPAALDTGEVGRQKSDFDRLLRYPADRAAERIIAAVVDRRRQLLIGPDARVYDTAARLAPQALARLMRRGARRATNHHG